MSIKFGYVRFYCPTLFRRSHSKWLPLSVVLVKIYLIKDRPTILESCCILKIGMFIHAWVLMRVRLRSCHISLFWGGRMTLRSVRWLSGDCSSLWASHGRGSFYGSWASVDRESLHRGCPVWWWLWLGLGDFSPPPPPPPGGVMQLWVAIQSLPTCIWL